FLIVNKGIKKMNIPVYQLAHAHGLPLPSRATPQSAGMDLMAALPEKYTLILLPGDRGLTPTGLIMAIPEGYEAQIRPRSGLALKHGVTVLNSPGTIDADYRNEVMVLLINQGQAPFEIRRGDRIAQILIAPVHECSWDLVESADGLGNTERGLGGYGSTGV
ncbi:MAG: dUTP diphosphatase, partial [Holophagales bacterium]|nr:dUTP diphosphatase [Holophagales bacterium]